MRASPTNEVEAPALGSDGADEANSWNPIAPSASERAVGERASTWSGGSDGLVISVSRYRSTVAIPSMNEVRPTTVLHPAPPSNSDAQRVCERLPERDRTSSGSLSSGTLVRRRPPRAGNARSSPRAAQATCRRELHVCRRAATAVPRRCPPHAFSVASEQTKDLDAQPRLTKAPPARLPLQAAEHRRLLDDPADYLQRIGIGSALLDQSTTDRRTPLRPRYRAFTNMCGLRWPPEQGLRLWKSREPRH